MEGVKEWWFTKRIEDMPAEELAERIKVVMGLDLKKKIVTIPYVGGEEVVEYKTDELIGLCPATGYPDYYNLYVRYIPDKLLPELKSFKFYLMQYKDLPISHEHLAEKIYQDFKEVVKPNKLFVKLEVARRGGIDTTIWKVDKELDF